MKKKKKKPEIHNNGHSHPRKHSAKDISNENAALHMDYDSLTGEDINQGNHDM